MPFHVRGAAIAARIFPVIAGTLALAACSEPTAPRLDLLRAEARWAASEPVEYSYILDQSCECLVTGPVLIAVREGEVVGAMRLPFTTPPLPDPDPGDVPTITELLARLRLAAESDPVAFEAEFDPDYGYPTSGSYDISAQIADDEYAFEAREFRVPEPLTD